ncbi:MULTISPECIES: hypothetical protein [unclassified Nostoc]|nr:MULTISPECIES: hypothetical protein [unclassified Nostoc]
MRWWRGYASEKTRQRSCKSWALGMVWGEALAPLAIGYGGG